MTCIAIIDGIIDKDCNSLRGVTLSIEQSMIPEGFDKPDSHATEIASLIFGNSAEVSADPNPLTCLSLPIFFHSGTGSTAAMASQMDLARALTIAAERNVAIVNISAGQKAASTEAGRHLQDAVSLCLSKRILIIAAAGNDGCACLHVPAAINGVLAVGAMDLDGRPFEQSNFGEAYKANGILAPGVNLQVTGTDNQTFTRSGTSYATAVSPRLLDSCWRRPTAWGQTWTLSTSCRSYWRAQTLALPGKMKIAAASWPDASTSQLPFNSSKSEPLPDCSPLFSPAIFRNQHPRREFT